MDIAITRSKKADTRFDAVIDGRKTVSFGQKRGKLLYQI